MCPFVGGFELKSGRGTGAADKVVRILKMAWMLQGGSHTVDDMAAQFAVSRRTVYRDLKLIDQASLPLVVHPIGKGYHLAQPPRPPITLPLSALRGCP